MKTIMPEMRISDLSFETQRAIQIYSAAEQCAASNKECLEKLNNLFSALKTEGRLPQELNNDDAVIMIGREGEPKEGMIMIVPLSEIPPKVMFDRMIEKLMQRMPEQQYAH